MAAQQRRGQPALWAVLVIAIAVAAGSFTAAAAGAGQRHDDMASMRAAPAVAVCARETACGHPLAIAAGRPPVYRPPRDERMVPRPRRPVPRPAVSPPAAPVPSPADLAVQQVLTLINEARARAGLAPYVLTAGLDRSAAGHDSQMAAGCGLSHQCAGEPPLGGRETAAGVTWTDAGENVGDGGPVADSATAIAQMAASLTQTMLDETPPGDGHRLNLLSTVFRHIGIAVYRDGSGTVWLTQDFSN